MSKQSTNVSIEKINNRLNSLREDKSWIDGKYDDIKKYFLLPYEKQKHDVNSIGFCACEQLAAFLHTSMTNPSVKWLSLNPMDENRDDKEILNWLQKVENIIYEVFSSPETYLNSQIHEMYLELVGFGTGVLYIQEDKDSPFGLYFISVPLKECLIDEGHNGMVDTVYREFTMTVRQVEAQFDTEMTEEEDKNKEVIILHAIEPDPDKKNKYLSVYINKKNEEILDEDTLNYMPYLVVRWSKRSGSKYGVSPAMIALSEIKRLQQYEKLIERQSMLALDPPLFLSSNDSQYPIQREAGGVNFYKNYNDKAYTLPVGDIAIGDWLFNEKKEAIARCFYLDVINLQPDKNMTATEVMHRMQQQAKVMSPVTSRIESELLRPLVIKTYQVLATSNNNILPEIDGQFNIEKVKFEYISSLSRGQKSEETQQYNRLLDITSILANFDPNIIDSINLYEFLKQTFKSHNISLDILRSEQEVESIKKERQQAEAAGQTGMQSTNSPSTETGTPNLEGMYV